MARTLEQAVFSVTKLEDTSYSELREAIWDFGKQLREADAVLFYFSGHGVQYNGSNYLLPLGTRLETPRHIQLQAVSENEVLAEMEGGTEDRVNDEHESVRRVRQPPLAPNRHACAAAPARRPGGPGRTPRPARRPEGAA
jgi:hypothetical protein